MKLAVAAAERAIEIYNLPFAFVAALIVNIVVSALTPSRPAAGPTRQTAAL